MQRNRPSDWCKNVREAGVVAVAQAFGAISTVRDGRGGMRPCPACGAPQRGSSDKRGPLGMTHDRGGWKCYRCDAKGDAVTLASYLSGQSGTVNAAVREACERVGLLAPGSAPVLPPRKPANTDVHPSYPSQGEVSAMVRQLFAIDYAPDLAAASWVASRGLDVRRVAKLGAVVALMKDAEVPHWARCRGRPWSQSGHRLVAPLCDSKGALRSLHARQIDAAAADMPKGTNPAGFDVRGLVLACPRARRMLAGQEQVSKVLITEGLPDWLTWTHHFDVHSDPVATFGVVAGAWTKDFAAKLAPGTEVLLAGHNDAAGQAYVRKIIETLRDRIARGEIIIRQKRAA